MSDILSDVEDWEILEEVVSRGLEHEFEGHISGFSDEQIIQECEIREIYIHDPRVGLNKIYHLMASNKPYLDELKELIFQSIGRIL